MTPQVSQGRVACCISMLTPFWTQPPRTARTLFISALAARPVSKKKQRQASCYSVKAPLGLASLLLNPQPCPPFEYQPDRSHSQHGPFV